MYCYIYRSEKKPDTYLYLPTTWDEADLPDDLNSLFTPATLAMELELDPSRSLVREDIAQVLDNLLNQGYHVQLPPSRDELT